MRIKRDKLDILFSKVIRERDDWTCQKCGTSYPEGSRGLECSHLYSRRHKNTRWSPDNAVAHCTSCHFYLGGNPLEFGKWAEEYLGKARYEALRAAHRTIKKWSKSDKEAMYQHFKSEYQRLRQLRNEGKQGRLNVRAYEEV